MKYAKLSDDVVVQVQPYSESGFELVPDNVMPGMVKSGDAFIVAFDFLDSISRKINEIELARDQALYSESSRVIASGAKWQVDKSAMAELNDAITLFTALGATPDDLEWRDADNVNHPATLDLLLSIASARAVQKDAIWKHSWQLKAQLEALDSETATQADIDNIVVEFN